MQKKNLQKYWKTVSEKLNLKADIPYQIKYSDGSVQEVDFRLKDFGSKNGMLLVSDYDIIKNRSKEIAEMEYAYSCIPEPSDERINQTINASPEDLIKGVKNILLDWGYFGPDSEKPKWLNDTVFIKAKNKKDGIAEEYAILYVKYGEKNIDWRLEKQVLKKVNDIYYDEINIILKNGEKKITIFDISSFYGKF